MEKKELLEMVDALAQQVNKSDLQEIEVQTDDFRIRLSKPWAHSGPIVSEAHTVMAHPIYAEEIEQTTSPTASGKFIKSPIIGTFYAAAAPGNPPFVSVGDKVSKGSVVCIVESMKLMNEITSDFDGTVAEILVSDGEAVEFDQPLIRVE